MSTPKNNSAIVLGGGIAGLAAAHFLKKQGRDVLLFEAADQPGGKISTERVDGFTLERGPNTVLLNTVGLIELVRSAGLWEQVLHPRPEASKNRFVIASGELVPVPTGPGGFVGTPLLGAGDKLRLLRESFLKAYDADDDPSIAEFTRRRFGENFLRNFIAPFVTGIYAGDPEKLSARYALKLLWEAEQSGGSVTRGFFKLAAQRTAMARKYDLPKLKMFTLPLGLGTLAERLAEDLGASYRGGMRVEAVESGEHGFTVYARSGMQNDAAEKSELRPFSAETLWCALPAHPSAKLFAGLDPSLVEQLQTVPEVPARVVHLGFEPDSVGEKRPAFGALTRSDGPRSFLGVLFNSRIFPHTASNGQELFTVITGGARCREMAVLAYPELRERVLADLEPLLHLRGEPVFERDFTWGPAIPQYLVGHGRVVDAVHTAERRFPGLHMIGSYIDGISVGDCVDKAYRAVQASC